MQLVPNTTYNKKELITEALMYYYLDLREGLEKFKGNEKATEIITEKMDAAIDLLDEDFTDYSDTIFWNINNEDEW